MLKARDLSPTTLPSPTPPSRTAWAIVGMPWSPTVSRPTLQDPGGFPRESGLPRTTHILRRVPTVPVVFCCVPLFPTENLGRPRENHLDSRRPSSTSHTHIQRRKPSGLVTHSPTAPSPTDGQDGQVGARRELQRGGVVMGTNPDHPTHVWRVRGFAPFLPHQLPQPDGRTEGRSEV